MKSDIEILLNAIITKNTDNLPIPNSRIEKLLYALATGNEEGIETPKSRIEECLYYILKNGGVGGGSSSSETKYLTLTDNVNVEVVEV